MIFFPAIDLKDGQCVRLVAGDMGRATVFNDDPAAQARSFAAAGCGWLHVVDLNGAIQGRPINGGAVGAIVAATDARVQLGGGIRTMETIAFWLGSGVRRVVLGTAAVKDPDLVRQACRDYPRRIVLGIDARDGWVAVEGWAETAQVTAGDLARRFEDAGAAAVVHTDIGRDGAMKGPNLAATLDLARDVSIPVIASGGVASMDDIRALKRAGDGLLAGVISGRAIYDGHVDPAAAAALLAA